MTPRLRFFCWIIAVVALLGGQLVWLFLLRGPRILDSDSILIGGQAVLALPVLAIAALLATTPADAIKLRTKTSERLIVGGVVVLQAAAVVLLRPGLSEDVLRYRVDGRMWLAGVSPYATAPAEFGGRDDVDRLTPFAGMRTIYPTVAQGTFALSAAVDRGTGDPRVSVDADAVSPWRRHLADRTPYRATSFRVIYALAAVAATVVLLLLLRATGRSPWWATLLAWNPLVTLEVGGMGHVDVVGVLLVLLGLYAMTRSRPLAAAAMLAMAVAVKPIALLVAPFMIRDAGGRRVAAAAVFAATLALLYAPPMLFQNGYAGWRQQARTYSQSWEANGSFYELITRTFGVGDEGRAMQRAKEMSRLLGAAAVIGVALAAWRFGASPAAAGYWLCLTTLLVSPVAYPWYLMWALCFVPMLDGRAGWTAMVWAATAAVSYVAWHQPTWRLNSSTLLVEYTPVYVTLLVEVAMALRRARFAATRDDAGDVATPLFTARSC